jgi:hypothetical protein
MPPGRLLEAHSNVCPRGMIAGAPRVTSAHDRTRLTNHWDQKASSEKAGLSAFIDLPGRDRFSSSFLP